MLLLVYKTVLYSFGDFNRTLIVYVSLFFFFFICLHCYDNGNLVVQKHLHFLFVYTKGYSSAYLVVPVLKEQNCHNL